MAPSTHTRPRPSLGAVLLPLMVAFAPATAAAQARCPAVANESAAGAWSALRQGDLPRADSLFLAGLDRCPRHLGSIVGAGYVELRRGNDAEARSRLLQALEVQPRTVDALAGLGILAWRAGDLEEVRRRFLQVADIDPDNAQAADYLSRLPAGIGEAPDRPPLARPDTVVYPARVLGERFEVRTAAGWRPFYLKGVNLGAALPGRHASQFPDAEVYTAWVRQMAEMGANVVRVYTIHPPALYAALAAHNEANPGSPLWLVHGVWTELPPEHDFYDPTWEGEFFGEMERVVDVVHGRADLAPRPGHASGFYTADVSPWTLAWIIGREWEPYAIVEFNETHAGEPDFHGDYLGTAGGVPADGWMARALDHMVSYEMERYNAQRPVAYTNWPTLDPLRHSTETTVDQEVAIRETLGETILVEPLEYDNDTTSLDATLVRATPRLPAGHFASFHAYPYYPDFIGREPAYRDARSPEGASSYFGYLRDLARHHRGMPVVISEYGVPASQGFAHLERHGVHHGGAGEEAMAAQDARMTRDIRDAGMAGGIVFAWIDEWFKKNWVTIEFELPPERNRLWYNRMDAEQHYGMIAWEAEPAVPGESAANRLAAWRDVAPLYDSPTGTLRTASDAANLWLLVEAPADAAETVVGFDVVLPDAGDRALPGVPGTFDVGLEFALRLTGQDARLLVDQSYNQYEIYAVEAPESDREPVTMDAADPPPGRFAGRYEQRLGRPYTPVANADGRYDSLLVVTNRRRFGRDSTEYLALGYDRGRLLHGGPPDGQWERLAEGVTEVRIPWNLLNVTDPSQRRVLLDTHPAPDSTIPTGTTLIDGIGLVGAVRVDGGWTRWPRGGPVARHTWDTWEEPAARQRVRPVYDSLRHVFRTLGAPPTAPDPSASSSLTTPADTLEAVLAAADSAWNEGDTERAERLYDGVLAADSLHGTALHRMALLRAWDERYQESLTLFDRLISANPDDTSARIGRARVLAWQGRLDPAVAAIEAVLDEDPGNVEAIQALAQFRSWAGDYEEALTTYDRLEQLDPGRARVPYDRAQVLAWASRFEDAAAVYDSILAVDPDNLDALRGAARTAAWAGDLRAAERRWRQVLTHRPDDAMALSGLSQTLRWQGREADALPIARRAVELTPQDADARTELALVEAAVGPQASPGYAYESDSDGNRISTISTVMRFRPLPGPGPMGALELRADLYHRNARQEAGVEIDHASSGGSLTGRYTLPGGWSVSGGVGASASDSAGTTPSLTLGVTTPRTGPFSGGVAFRRQAFDATARLVEQDVTMTELAADGSAALAAGTRMEAGLGAAWFRSDASGESNRRWSAYGSVSYQPARPFTLVATTRAFGFQRDLNDGYFDPDFFGLAELVARLEYPVGPLRLGLDAAPGLQQVGGAGEPKGVARGTARLTWRFSIGRELSISGLVANAGLQRLSPDGDPGYRYHAITARLTWTL